MGQRYRDFIEIAWVATCIAGPQRPPDLLESSEVRATLAKAPNATVGAMAPVAWSSLQSRTAAPLPIRGWRHGGALGAQRLRQNLWVKTSGSPAAVLYLTRAGSIGNLDVLGSDIVGSGCMTCIGNSGAPPRDIEAAVVDGPREC